MACHMLADLTTDMDNWTIKVRILRMREAVNTRNNNEVISLDLIIIDEYVRRNKPYETMM